VKVVARAHKTLICRTHPPPAAAARGVAGLLPRRAGGVRGPDRPEALQLPVKAPDPASARRLTITQISATLRRAGRYKIAARAERIRQALRGRQLTQPGAVAAAYAATVRTQTALPTVITEQIAARQEQVQAHFGAHPGVETYRSAPGLGMILGARVLAEFGDDPHRYASAQARKNYAGTAPITR
jgi:hypothetical protein